MSAMTRLRNDPITEQPNDLVATYYEQRSNLGSLIVSEGILRQIKRDLSV